MTPTLLATLDRFINRVRRRLFGDRLLHAVGVGLSAGLAVGLVWLLAEPWLLAAPPDGLRWWVLSSAAGLGLIAGAGWAFVGRPTREAAALELDRRFDLRERVTTALGLQPDERETSAGQALLTDASAKVEGIRVGEKFPIRPRWSLGGVPVLAALIAAAVFFYHPDTSSASNDENPAAAAAAKKLATKVPGDAAKLPTQPFTKQVVSDQLDRKKSAELQKLEAELNATMEKWRQNEPKDEQQAREKVTELTALEEKLKKFKEQEYQKLKQAERQLQQLDRLTREKEFEDGPAKEFNEALSKGNLKKAQEDVEELRKKAKEQKLDAKDLERLDGQLKEMAKQLRDDKQNKEKADKLQKKIDQAKKEGKDAEGLERELDQLKAEMKQSAEQTEKLAEKMEKLRQLAEKGDLEELTEELQQMGSQLKGLEQEVQDLEDADDFLQRLREELGKACKKCQGEGKNDGTPKPKDDAEWTPNGNPGLGKRGEDKDAKTNNKDERVRGLFDKNGQKRYAGAVKGPSFTKKSTVELDQQIQQAAQEAPQAMDSQQVPKEAQAGVKEYFEKIGGTKK
ncbi:hypothetical protein [Limnoglobus roseus]|uniref:Chromosome partition protein Smc n=1 Tax=Limnoglobus roseus TaxID=2598579 RepID=A0A5C1AI17_9BACT|nr:hypothetical protein [Limnoglobus roseus]QEL17312.1 hypothetical protein PX52LOC_04295 [Limnoglobus roseus]